MVLGLILLLYSMASKTWLKNCLNFNSWDRIFARVCFCESSFLNSSFRHQDSNNYYLVYVRLWASIFRYVNLKIVPLIASELFNHNLSIVHTTLFLNFVMALRHTTSYLVQFLIIKILIKLLPFLLNVFPFLFYKIHGCFEFFCC